MTSSRTATLIYIAARFRVNAGIERVGATILHPRHTVFCPAIFLSPMPYIQVIRYLC
jgi:hypothetical protein